MADDETPLSEFLTTPEPTDAPAPPASAARDPRQMIGVLYHGLESAMGVDYLPYPQDEPSRTLVLDGVTCAHCGTDADGVWLYRQEPK